MVRELQIILDGEIRIWQILIAACCFAFFFVDIHRFHDKLGLRFKPFSCTSCLSAWTALLLLFLPNVVTDIMIIMFGAGVAVLPLKLFLDILWKKSI